MPGLPASKVGAGSESNVLAPSPAKEMSTESQKGQFAVPTVPASKIEDQPEKDAKDATPAATKSREEGSGLAPPAQHPPLNYDTPEWSSAPKDERYFEVLKNGRIVSKSAPISKAFLIAGRLPICDFELEHPSISRYHAVIQFKDDGTAYLYDLGSTHGTFLNKNQIPKRDYQALRIGDMIRFGASTRIYILQGHQDEVDMSEAESVQLRTPQRLAKPTESSEPTEITWGFAEDAIEEDDQDNNDAPDNDMGVVDENAYYHADPRKALRTWLEARGMQMTFQVEEDGPGHDRIYTAKMDLPVETSYGTTMQAIGTGGRKRAAEVDAALDACIKLDKRGLLRSNRSEQAQKDRQRKKEMFGEENDDEDSFYDRTSQSSKQKTKPAAKSTKTETYDSLVKKRDDLLAQIENIQRQVDEDVTPTGGAEEEDEIDEFMASLRKKEALQAKEVLKRGIPPLQREVDRLEKLIKMVAPSAAAILLPIPKNDVPPKSESATAFVKPTAGPRTAQLPPSVGRTSPIDEMAEDTKQPEGDEADLKRKAPSVDAKKQETPADPNQALLESNKPNAKRRRVYGMLTESQVEEHMAVESEDAVDWIAPDVKANANDVEKLNADYGY
ncbi:hypothetical protein PhCBS80983_g04684 [Powellomyces hirtus]|uniref:FHA domain-containing protein n=1 Tax=Powellomyces hirtus TaxID=109895 RepID=A0A507DZH1_9FUNG|nr:hypothetical protein PhCBS80983_g04684 [Powellomyces hirtus]